MLEFGRQKDINKLRSAELKAEIIEHLGALSGLLADPLAHCSTRQAGFNAKGLVQREKWYTPLEVYIDDLLEEVK